MKWLTYCLALLATSGLCWISYLVALHFSEFFSSDRGVKARFWLDQDIKWLCSVMAGLGLVCLVVWFIRNEDGTKPNWKVLVFLCPMLTLVPAVVVFIKVH